MEFTLLNQGLGHSATSPICTKALAFLMGENYDVNDLAKFMFELFNVKAFIRQCGYTNP